MRVLVAYASQFGSTEEIAQHIAEILRAEDLEVDVRPADGVAELDYYDAYVLGSAVHGGHWLKEATQLARRQAPALGRRPVWLFSSGPVGERYVAAPQPEPAEVRRLRENLDVRDHRVFAGAFDKATADLASLSLVERTVVSAFLPEGDFRDWPQIEQWARSIASELRSARGVLVE